MSKRNAIVRTYKSHSAASFFMGFFSLLFVASFAAFLFLPAFTFTKTEPVTYTGLDYTFFGLAKFIQPFFPDITPDKYTDLVAYFENYEGSNFILGIVKNIHPYLQIALSALVAGAIVLAVIEALLSLVWFIRGRIIFPKSTLVLARWSSGLFDTSTGLLYLYLFLFGMIVGESGDSASASILVYPLVILGVQTVLIIIIHIIYNVGYKNRVYEKSNFAQREMAKMNGGQPMNSQTAHKNEANYVPVYEKGLPDNLRAVEGSAFANDPALTQAKIPEGISVLGSGAFANCRNLRIVTIPSTVVKIGANCFYNTPNLKTIYYAGTQADWMRIRRGGKWLVGAGTTSIQTRDAVIVVNPNE